MSGLFFSFLLIFAVLALGLLLKKLGADGMLVRKVIHMGVGNWWFIEMRSLDTLALALVGPLAFLVLNTLFVFLHRGESEEKRNYGLIYYPLSLLLLVLLQFRGVLSSRSCLIGVLAMAYGDSLAALAGRKLGGRRLPLWMREKTVSGFLVMALVSFLCAYLVSRSLSCALAVGLTCAVSEAATPFGLDNLTVPLLGAFVAGVFP